jgi:hypothetical protein
MSRSRLPQSAADWFAAVFTLTAVVALVWLIAAVPLESRRVAVPVAGTTPAGQVRARSAGAPTANNCFPAQFMAPECSQGRWLV